MNEEHKVASGEVAIDIPKHHNGLFKNSLWQDVIVSYEQFITSI